MTEEDSSGAFNGDTPTAILKVIKLLQLKSIKQKFSFSDVVRLYSDSFQEPKKTEIDRLGWTVLRGLLAYDRTARDISIAKKDTEPEAEDPFCDFESPDSLNPMDVLQACFLCCDPEVQQILCKALFTCKLAFPFIYSDREGQLTLSQWNLRDIVVEYRDSQGRYLETSLVSEHPFPVVCFARIGEIGTSKSKLLNSLLFKSSLDTFFHHDCNNGDVRRQCTNGLVEATVFLPSEGPSSTFSKAFVLANLRGDLLEHSKEFQAVAQVADIVVLMVEIKALESSEVLQAINILRHRQVLLIVFKKEDRLVKAEEIDFKSLPKEIIWAFRGMKSKNETQLLSEISKKLESLLAETEGLKLTALNQNASFETDECNHVLAESRTSAFKVIEHMNCSDSEMHEFKTKHLPLQAIWMEYSQLHKKENSSKAEKKDLQEIQRQKAEKRTTQIARCRNLSAFMKDFVQQLTNSCLKSEGGLPVQLLIQWEKLLFDEISRKKLPDLHRNRKDIRTQLQSIFQQKDTVSAAEDVEKCTSTELQKKFDYSLRQVEKTILEMSIGMENVFREVGQFFEATCSLNDTDKTFGCESEILPEVFARLLLWGIPLEILDGDASNIPLTWVTSVLTHCKQLVGQKNILAVSVLGLQSSGKSTLLNTMFGLKFAVSAGRCTRGAFLQLVPVEPGSSKFDFVAVIDTEGLRAPELGLDKYRHDNELATLVLGLGDVTVINLKGENSAEIKDILQIVVHAFIRMKMANRMQDLRRRCIFVHQNVPAVGAKEKMMDQNCKMQEDLDKITREAAEGEKVASVRCFSDIISFDSDKDIFYMSDLWLGDPPMAPVNPGYSHKVTEIKTHILHCLDEKHKTFLGFDDFALRIKDLWTAIMSEDFVFSFRNSIEMKAYNLMESEFFDVKRRCDVQLNEWLTKTASIQLQKCTTSESVQQTKERLRIELHRLQDNCETNGMDRLMKFFDENPYSEQTIQWKSNKANSLSEYVRSLGGEVTRKLDQFCDLQLLETEQKSKQSQWERAINSEARKAAEEMPEGCPDDEVEKKFESLWKKFLGDLPPERIEYGESVLSRIENFLRECYPKERQVIRDYLDQFNFEHCSGSRAEEISDLTEQQLFENDNNSFFEIRLKKRERAQQFGSTFTGGFIFSDPNENAKDEAKSELTEISNRVFRQVKTEVADISKSTRWFEETDASRVQKVVADGLNRELTDFKRATTTIIFEIKVVILALRYAYPHFVEFDQRFRDSCSIKAKTDKIKERIRNMFFNMVRRQSGAKIAADYVRDHLKKVIQDAINQRLKEKLKSKLIAEIGNGKFHLIVRILDDFSRKRKFKKILRYVVKSETAALNWLDQFIPEFLSQKPSSSDESRLLAAARELLDPILVVVTRADEKAHTESSGSLKQWIVKFCENVESELAVIPQDLETALPSNDSNIDLSDFTDFFRPAIEQIRVQTIEKYKFTTIYEVDRDSQGETLNRLVLKSFWGCTAQCPFCSEPCSKDDANHYENEKTPHTCIQHRPQGARGRHEKDSKQLVFRNCEWQVSCGGWGFCCITCRKHSVKTSSCAPEGEEAEKYHPFKNYKDFFPNWDIKPDPSNFGNKFWMWFCATFVKELGEYYKKPVDNLPVAWKSVSEKEALESLRSLRQ
ncbi:hypothetical protein BOX15_Mlig002402g2 [Macrostomum lignano]|uniref:VLIG-type G domain-containing protein n=1 Tax=Macrostomum lignano TaxID=282301 RepID=A0A267DXH9_9PLAT|nr:hypothetical protein BOX15_Mlig002402g2 [Macrostomum lignano]